MLNICYYNVGSHLLQNYCNMKLEICNSLIKELGRMKNKCRENKTLTVGLFLSSNDDVAHTH